MARLILSFVFLLFCNCSFGQLKIEVGEYYLPNQKLKKLHVNAEDHSVWVINDAGKVYYKEKTATAFSIFQPVAQLSVTEVVGYNMDEMYFLVNGDLLYFKNKVNQTISFTSGKKMIYSLVPIYGRHEIKADKSSDRLLLGFSGGNAELKRGQTVVDQLSPDGEAADWKVHYYGLKSFSASYNKIQSNYCYESDRVHFSGNSQSIFGTTIPDKTPHPVEKTSIILIEGAYSSLNLSAWSTHEGLFIKGANGCQLIHKKLDGQVVNAMEVVENLAFYNKNQFLIAATNNGLQYTPKKLINTNLPGNEIATFELVQALPQVKFTKVMAETSYIGSYWSNINIYCEKAVWATTENGLYRLYLKHDQDVYTNSTLTSLSYNKTPSNNDNQSPIFNLCAGETVRVANSIPNLGSSQMMVQWFKDGVEDLSLRGQLNTTLNNAGVYKCKVTLMCENISISSNEIKINQAAAPEITFSYPPEINICPSGSFTLQTKAVNGYAYQWFKDNSAVVGATQNQFVANTAGNYRVQVSNCAGSFLSSTTVKINVAEPNAPIYCQTSKRIVLAKRQC